MKFITRLAAILILLLVGFGLVLAFGPSLYWRTPEVPPELGEGDVERGAYIAAIAGCESCHTGDEDGAPPLAGGRRLETRFGTFVVPNITPDEETGIGGWTMADFVRAMTLGLSPDGRHYYPAFPYTSYTRMSFRDIVDLKAYLDSVPPVRNDTARHELDFPYTVRPGIGLWKFAFFDPRRFTRDPSQTEAWFRGAYLALGPGHCVECHTPRNFAGALDMERAFAGTESGPEGDPVPNITQHPDGIADWERIDLDDYLSSGLMPDGDVAGGAMAEVIRNSTSKLTGADRRALAIYILSLPQRPSNGGDE